MLMSEYQAKLEYFTDILGVQQVKVAESVKWGYAGLKVDSVKMRKAFIYLNTLSRYAPERSNSITEAQASFIFTQLGKLLPCAIL